MADTVVAASLQVDTGNSAAKVNEVNSALKETKTIATGAQTALDKASSSAKEGGGHFANLKNGLLTTSPAFKSAGEATKGFSAALDIVRANPIVFVLTTLAAVLVGIVKYMSGVDGAADSLNRSWAALSTIVKAFTDKVLSPLIDVFSNAINVITKAATVIADFFSPGLEEAANRAGELRDELNDLEDAQKNNAIAVAEANLKLAEARDIAADSTKTVKERAAALVEAAKIEKQQADEVYKTNLAIYKNRLEQMAIEMNVRKDLIEQIKKGNIEELKGLRAKLLAEKNVNGDRLLELDNFLTQAIEAQAASQKVQTKTDKQITALEKEEQSKRESAAKEANEKRKAAQEKHNAEALKEAEEQQRKLLKIATDGQKAIDDAIEDLRKGTRESEYIKLQEEFNARVKAAEEAGLSTLKIRQAYQKDRNELEEKFAKEDADAQKKKDDEEAARLVAKGEKAKAIAQQSFDDKMKSDKEQQDLLKEINESGESPEDLELARLQATYAKKFEIAQGNEELISKLIEDYESSRQAIRQRFAEQQVNLVGQIANTVSGVIGEQTAVGKGLAIAEATINTYLGASQVLRQPGTNLLTKIAGVAAALAVGFKTVRGITATQVPGGGASAPAPAPISLPAPLAPQQTSTALDANTIQQVGNAAKGGAIQAFMLTTQANGAQEREARLARAARLG